LLTDCGQNAYELVHVERILATQEDPAKSALSKMALIPLPPPKESWILFFKKPIG